jgi:hypothetical protein
MKKIITPQNVTPYPEVTERPLSVKWEEDAIESLQSLERYTVLKAIEEGKRLVKRVMESAAKQAADGVVTKVHVQNSISNVIDELELSRQKSSSV